MDQIDCFVGGWTSQADEVAMLTYRLRTAVPASLTGQLQLTDVGLAQPAKASLQRYLEELKDRMRAKARAEGVHPTYKASETDILQGALEMHDTMVKLNSEKQTVLRVARACGWLHYRPDGAGNLVEAGRQPWAKDFPEGHSKLGPELLAQRGSFVREGKPVPLEKREEGQEEEGELQPARQFENAPTHSGFFFDMPLDFDMSEKETEQILELLQHPRERQNMPWLQKVSQTTSQKKARKDKQKKKGLKKEALEEWRKKAGKKSQKAAVQQVVPEASRGKGKKQKPSSKLKTSLKMKSSVARKLLKRAKKKAEKAKQAKEAHAEEEIADSTWVGKTAKVVGETGVALWQGSLVKVRKARTQTVLCDFQGQQRWMVKEDLECPVKPGKAASQLAPKETAQKAREALRREPDMQVTAYRLGELVSDEQIVAGMAELRQRLMFPESIFEVRPVELKAAMDSGEEPAAVKLWKETCF